MITIKEQQKLRKEIRNNLFTKLRVLDFLSGQNVQTVGKNMKDKIINKK